MAKAKAEGAQQDELPALEKTTVHLPWEAFQDLITLPVRMAVPEKGLCFAFEKLLVLEEALFVETEYAKEKVAK